MPSANADSSSSQTIGKFGDKCRKAQEKDSQKKADHAADQANHHHHHHEKFGFPFFAGCTV
jgi:hypothetical protein